jgi:aerobic carbon-monoxide dehydrogenase medium subunit
LDIKHLYCLHARGELRRCTGSSGWASAGRPSGTAVVKPARFKVDRPGSVDEGLRSLAEYGDAAKVLAGGQSLIPLLALRLTRFDVLVDLNGVEGLSGVERRNGFLSIGAMTRQTDIEGNPMVREHVPLLAEATGLIGHFQIRNRGTIGGSLVHADAAAEYPAVALALDFEFEIQSPQDSRRVPAADFFLGHWTTAVAEDEILIAVHAPIGSAARRGQAIREFARRHGDFALAGAVASIGIGGDGAVEDAAFTVFAAADRPLRLPGLEAELVGHPPKEIDIEAAAQAAVSELSPGDDIHASAEFRGHLLRHLLADAFTESVRRVQGTSHAR